MVEKSIVSLPTDRAHFHAFEVTGKITKADIERMADHLSLAFDVEDQVDVLVIITNWEGIEFGAVLDSKSIAAQFRANRHVRKYGVVGAPEWAEAMISLFSPLTPVQAKTFPLEAEEEAWNWVSA